MFENGTAVMCNLADKYEHGLGVARDYAQALHWYGESAAMNNVAQYSLGMMNMDGRCVTRDVDRARQWLLRSAAQGYQDARAALEALDSSGA